MKKRFSFIILLVTLFVALTACRGIRPPKHNIHTSYKEWAKAIGLYSTKLVRVSCYDNEHIIQFGFENLEGVEGYKEVCEVINAHNRFVDENPDYFPDDIEITAANRSTSNLPWHSMFFNYAKQGEDRISFYLKDLGREKSAKMQYMCIDLFRAEIESEENGLEIDVPVVILQFDNPYPPTDPFYDFLSDCKNVEQVIIEYTNMEYDVDEACESIRKRLPEAEIYIAQFDHLEKCP